MNNPLRLTLIWILILYTHSLPGQNYSSRLDIVAIDTPYIDLMIEGQIWVDSFSQLSKPEEILHQDFQKITSLQLGASKHAYWLQFKIQNRNNQEGKYWLQAGVFDSLLLIQQEESHLKIQQRGLLINYSPNEKGQFQNLIAHKYGFALSLPPHSTSTFYLRIKNIVRFESTLEGITLLAQEQHEAMLSRQTIYFSIFSAFFFGILLFLTIFSLSQYVQIKDKSYIFYALYLSLISCYFWWKFEKSNALFNFLFTNFPDQYYFFEAPLTILIYVSYFLFVAYFLNAKDELPRFYKLLWVGGTVIFSYFGITILVSFFGKLSLGWEMVYWMRLLLIPISFIAIYVVFKAKHQLGFYILTGTLLMLLGGTITTFLSKTLTQHYFGPWDIPLLPIQIGIILETFFFAAGLGYKSRLAAQERVKMQINLDKGYKETAFLKKRKEYLTKLYTNISHESRTPLTVIMGAMQQIKGHQRERELIKRNSHQLLKLINQVLDVNKLEANKMVVNWQQGDIMQYIRYCVEPFEILAQKKAQSFELVCLPKQLVMDFDTDKLQKIVNNLVANAIKFTPEKGRIRIDAYQDTRAEKAMLLLEISDSGPGIPTSFQEIIFDPYIQLPDTEGGSGLGLALVKELTVLLGGQIEINSDAGQGSTFTLAFPQHRHAPLITDLTPSASIEARFANEISLPKSDSFSTKKTSILLVEDNEDILDYLTQILKNDYNLFIAQDGSAGFKLAKEVYPDLILSDIMMPAMDGYELCDALKKHPTTQHIPIILLTAKASQQDRLEGLKHQADVFLTKPFLQEELLLQIHRLVQNGQQSISRPAEYVRHESPDNEAVCFLEKLHRIIDSNLDNEQFKTVQLCEELGMNHVTLNNKIKTLTGNTTGQYLRNYRLQIAKELLRSSSLTVAEVSYKIGVSEPSNFNNMFKKAFGRSPRQWREG